jgi:hypothetical protein
VPGSVGVLEELLESSVEAVLDEEVSAVGAALLARLCEP